MFSFPHSLLEFPCNEYLSVELDAFRVEICSLSVNARSFEDYGYSIYGDFSNQSELKRQYHRLNVFHHSDYFLNTIIR